LPRRDETGTAVAYYATHEANNDPIPDDLPLADCNVRDGDTVVLHAVPVTDPHETIDLELEHDPESSSPPSDPRGRGRPQQRPFSPRRRRILRIGCLIFVFLCCVPAACLTLITNGIFSPTESDTPATDTPIILGDYETAANTILVDFAVLDAEFSDTTHKLIMVSSNPPQVHLFDVGLGQDLALPLAHEPTAVSISQDGLTAVIAQDSHITMIDLTDRRITHEQDTTAVPHDIVLANNGWVYIATENRIHAVSITENREFVSTPLSTENKERVIRLSADGRFLYSTTSGTAPAPLEKFDITQTVPHLVENVNGNSDSRGTLWLYPTISQAVTSRGQIYRLAENEAEDRVFLGSVFSGDDPFIRAMSQVNQMQNVLLITTNNTSEIGVMSVPGWIQADVLPLPQVRLGREVVNGNGRYIFVNPHSLQYVALFTINEQWGIFTGNLSP
jgi:hypothetical protein